MLPLLSIHCTMYVTTWTISKRGNKWEMLSYEAWTDERTAVCHNKPVFWRAYKNERPISWNYKYIIFGQIIFQNFHQFKAFVGISDYSYGPIGYLGSNLFKQFCFHFIYLFTVCYVRINFIYIAKIIKLISLRTTHDEEV